MRKADNPVITGYEFHIINLVSYTCPKRLILPYLRETLEELKTREPDVKPPYRARVAIVGSEIDDPDFTKLLEECGALVVSDRYCFGSTPGREVLELKDDEPALEQICRRYMELSECARYISDEKVAQRRETADRLAREYRADGIIYEQMKYCARQPHHERREGLACAVHRQSLQRESIRTAAHALPGFRGIPGDQTHPERREKLNGRHYERNRQNAGSGKRPAAYPYAGRQAAEGRSA